MVKKKKFALWIYEDTKRSVEEIYKTAGCKSQSEFIEKAIKFYIGYLNAHQKNDFLPLTLTSVMEGVVESSEDRIARLLFKLSVETAIMMNIIASQINIDESSLIKLRGKCVKDVKQSNGRIQFDEVYKYQKGY